MLLHEVLRARAAALRAEADLLDGLAEQSCRTALGAAVITTSNAEVEFPGLTSRAFADAGRAGHFPAFKSGRKLAARREDVARWLESRRVRPRAKRRPPVDHEAAYATLVGGAR